MEAKYNLWPVLLLVSSLLIAGVQMDPWSRDKRSDDADPLEAVVSGLTHQTAQQAAQIATLQTQIQRLQDAASRQVGFHARFQIDNPHINAGQTVKFDLVLANVGSGYDAATGIFTAPVGGLYAFQFSTMNAAGDSLVPLLLRVNGVVLVYVDTDNYIGTGHGVFHLNRNDRVWVEGNKFSNTLYSFDTTFTGFLITPD